ncbi:hypothetical protein [Nocardioides sp. AE5]|uniref:hypothetical protein n=1 Tax=Nocardioides sp. AE5 TaxID=2962573 RepID=UPI00288193A7|nr:hypothetical protein [Nocardioides sp. AE5]MDT0202558.1 hypothetical protein [Nocardioides sp. AE5]
MRINLAPLVKGLVWVAFIGFYVLIQTGGIGPGTTDNDPYPSYDPAPSTAPKGQARAYLSSVAEEVARPGVWVDPVVIEDRKLSQAEVEQLDAAARAADGPMRIAVIDKAKILDDEGRRMAWMGEELVGQLYDRVGADGIYLVLVHDDRDREFSAVQFAEDGPTYDVEGAVNEAVDCCAPGYERMIATFIDSGDDIDRPFWWYLAWLTGIVAVIGAAVWLWRFWRRKVAEKRANEETMAVLHAPLNEEVVELSARVAALPPVTGADELVPGKAGNQLVSATRKVLDLVESARQKLDTMETAKQASEVTTRLADARYWLAVIEALRAGKEQPRRTAPCFFDPRHGPSTGTTSYKPKGGVTRTVEACDACLAEVEAKRQPQVRTFVKDGKPVFYWDMDIASKPYLDGYWQRRRHPAPTAQRVRALSFSGPTKEPSRGVHFVWESNSSTSRWSGGSSSGRSSSSSSSSSRSRSSGGGRSSRSSSRSSGSRRF